MYALTLGKCAPSKREDEISDQEVSLPAIGVAAAEDAARRLVAKQEELTSRFAEAHAKAEKILEDCTAQLTALIEKADAEITAIYDAMSAENDAYAELYTLVEDAYGEWSPAPEWFDDAHLNAWTDFDSELDEIDTVKLNIPSI